MKTDDILIAECAQAFIDDWGRTEHLGTTSDIMTEIQEHGITSPPEQLWYAAARTQQLTRWAGIFPQYPIGPYRADFMINPIGFFIDHPFNLFPEACLYTLSKTLQCLVVEIDGHVWHDKTPAQAERDKIRERFIQQQGFRLFRYAAREVLRDPRKCIAEIEEVVLATIRKACSQFIVTCPVTKTVYKPFEGLEDT